MTNSMMKYAEIESLVFANGRDITTFPVDVFEVVKKLKLDKPVEVIKTQMPNCIGGYTRKEKNGYYIMINERHLHRRQRFSVAHEIGHLYFKHKEASIHSWNYWDIHDNLQENQANEFAARLLMPATEMYQLSNIYNRYTLKLLEQIQVFFDVSLSATARRVTSLGIIEGSIILKDGKKTCFSYSSPHFPTESNYKTKYKRKLSSGKTLYILVAESWG
ncbi:MAG: hypothetical protein APF76_04565 [Desulfitibacter sp. BRH_c19]|nr:MAG: hypothetical protein APF76_04565 [Desulfitibacter sp. BRH_c19]